jgi:hypothetical protein
MFPVTMRYMPITLILVWPGLSYFAHLVPISLSRDSPVLFLSLNSVPLVYANVQFMSWSDGFNNWLNLWQMYTMSLIGATTWWEYINRNSIQASHTMKERKTKVPRQVHKITSIWNVQDHIFPPVSHHSLVFGTSSENSLELKNYSYSFVTQLSVKGFEKLDLCEEQLI